MTYSIYHLNDISEPLIIRDKLVDLNQRLTLFDADKIICKNQIKVAIDRAIRAEEQGVMIAKTWGIEVLLHLSGTHQIREAINLVGVNENTKSIIIVTDSDVEPIEGAILGYPEFNPTKSVIDAYKLSGSIDPCIGIISKGVDTIINHQ